MLLTIIDYVYFFLGIWCLFSGSLPFFLRKDKRIKYNTKWIRLFGLVLMLEYPASFLLSFFATIFYGEAAVAYYPVIGLVVITIFTWIAYLILTKINQQSTWLKYQSNPQKAQSLRLKQIEKQTRNALIYAIIGIFGLVTLIASPSAIGFSTQALKMIEEYKTGDQYQQKAKTARWIAILSLVFYGSLTLVFLWIVVSK